MPKFVKRKKSDAGRISPLERLLYGNSISLDDKVSAVLCAMQTDKGKQSEDYRVYLNLYSANCELKAL